MGSDRERARLLDALLEEVADKGYDETALSGALRRAGLEQNGFLAEFVNTKLALRAAYEAATGNLRDEAIAACKAARGSWPQQVAEALLAILTTLGESQVRANAMAVIVPGADLETRNLYQQFVEGMAPLLRAGRDFAESGDDLPAEVEMLAIGAAEAIICDEIARGRAEDLPLMGPQILFSLLVPFIGPNSAAEEIEAAKKTFATGGLEIA